MNGIEMIMLLVMVPIIIERVLRRSLSERNWWNGLVYVFVGASSLAALYHLFFMENRWPIVPLYLVIAWSLVKTVGAKLGMFRTLTITKGKKRYGAIFWVAAILAIVFPMFMIPDPTGPYEVGTTTRQFVDRSRDEVFTSNERDKRELMIRVWYPADTAGSDSSLPMSYFDFMDAQLQEDGYPRAIYKYFDKVSTHSRPDAALALNSEPYPVVIFSHGFAGVSSQSLYLVEELASQGYVVVGIDHTYTAALTEFLDGRVIPFNPELMNAFDSMAPDMVSVWSEDASFVLDELTRLNQEDPILKQSMDLTKAGMMGHSFGGTATVLTLDKDSRFLAGISMDAPIESIIKPAKLSKPLMFLEAGLSNLDMAMKRELSNGAEEDSYLIKLKGANHDSFSNYPLASPLFSSFFINKYKAYDLIDQYALSFFDKHLKDKTNTLLDNDDTRDSKIAMIKNE